ncbi:MAG: hypothetical protein IPM64_03005 [Phycisphaerales bacterium]|nr:hypothetical protein [Phycisphaerales bacterium]
MRLVAPGMQPSAVPLRSLAGILNAVQRLIDQREEDDTEEGQEPDPGKETSPRTLNLLDVATGSAVYRVGAPDRQVVLNLLSVTARQIDTPGEADWTTPTLSSLKELSDIARRLGCEIEFINPGGGGSLTDVIAKITPDTYRTVSACAIIRGETSIYARIERVGGATEMHCGIRLPEASRRMVICRVKTADLARELGQWLYQHVTLTGEAGWLRHGWQLKHFVISSFEPPKTGSIVDVLRKAHDSGGSAWDEIEDPEAYLAEMRRE